MPTNKIYSTQVKSTDDLVDWAKEQGYSQADIFRLYQQLNDTGYITDADHIAKLNKMLNLPEIPPHPIEEWLKKR